MVKLRVKPAFMIAAGALVAALAFEGCALQPSGSGDALARAIEAAKDDPAIPFHLDVACTDDKASRSLTVYRGRVAVWDFRRQVLLTPGERRRLLGLLLDAGFERFEAQYGGRRKEEEAEAALRVSCRILVTIDGLRKSSVQLFEGEQSAELIGLANDLLDLIEPRSAAGVSAGSLEDGLRKLREGALAPELFELRLLSLPADAKSRVGFIIRVQAGEISRQAYAPGRLVETPVTQRLTDCRLKQIVTALIESSVWSLPVNLRRAGMTELETAVLGHRKSVIARESFRNAAPDAQSAFDTLMNELEAQPAHCSGTD